jgi:hypothetical protein
MSIANELEGIVNESERINNNVQTTLNTIAATGVNVPRYGNSDDLPDAAAELVKIKQDKLTGEMGQFVGFNANGEAIAQNLPDKQDPITGVQGQMVGFDKSGNPIAQNVPEKQNPIKGRAGQMVGFDSSGNAVAQDFPDKQDPLSGNPGQMLTFDAQGKPIATDIPEKQDPITGSAGQFVGFNASGKPEAKDFPEPEPNTWDKIQGKPFCNGFATGTAVANGDTLSWDGNLDAMPIVKSPNGYIKWIYVSDNVPTMEQIGAGHTLAINGYSGNEININITPSESENYIYVGDIDGQYLYIIKKPCAVGSMMFERAGIYFNSDSTATIYTCRLTINGYTFTPCTAYAPIGEEYIPSSIQRVGNPLYLYNANGFRYEIIVGTDGALSTKRA